MVRPSSSSDCVSIEHLVCVRGLSCNIDISSTCAQYQGLLPSGEISSSTSFGSFSSFTLLIVDSRFLDQILSAFEKLKAVGDLVGRSLRKIGSFGVLPCVGVGLELNFQCNVM